MEDQALRRKDTEDAIESPVALFFFFFGLSFPLSQNKAYVEVFFCLIQLSMFAV